MPVIGTLQPQRTNQAFDIETAISSSRYDVKSQTNFFVRETVAGQLFTISIRDYEFDRDCGALVDEKSKARRREYLKRCLLNATEETTGEGMVGFSPVAEHNAGLGISPRRLEATLGRMTAEIDALKRQVEELQNMRTREGESRHG
jgi:hypothetical protein